MIYAKAPISEVICGVYFKKPVFSADEIMKINIEFVNDFPIVEVLPPLIIEQLVGNQLQANLESTSVGLFLYRRRTRDRRWLIQIQQNALYINWVRDDSVAVGDYPGFDSVLDQFKLFLNRVNGAINKTISFENAYFDLTYHNRIDLRSVSVSSLNQLNSIAKMSIPTLNSFLDPKTINTKLSYKIDEINGYGIFSISTDPRTESNILNYDFILRGETTSSVDEWFQMSKEIEDSSFESFFEESVLSKWK